jgi:hypothetical protein
MQHSLIANYPAGGAMEEVVVFEAMFVRPMVRGGVSQKFL